MVRSAECRASGLMRRVPAISITWSENAILCSLLFLWLSQSPLTLLIASQTCTNATSPPSLCRAILGFSRPVLCRSFAFRMWCHLTHSQLPRWPQRVGSVYSHLLASMYRRGNLRPRQSPQHLSQPALATCQLHPS